jgi:serine/threonine protein kinase
MLFGFIYAIWRNFFLDSIKMNRGKVINYITHKGKPIQILIVDEVGKGSFGTVYKGVIEGYGTVAVKLQYPVNKKLLHSIATEIKISKVFSEEYGFTVKRVIFNPSYKTKESRFLSLSSDVPKNAVLTIYNLAEGIDLQKLIEYNVSLTDDTAKLYIDNLLDCLKELKEKGIAHRDIKPGNLMLHNGLIKLIDFGFACFYAECTGKKGTLYFLPPEFYLPGDTMDWHKGDVFAVGITMLSLFTGGKVLYDSFFSNMTDGEKFFGKLSLVNMEIYFERKILSFANDYPLVQKYKNLILGMINPNPENRWTLEKCFEWVDSNSLEEAWV